MADKKKSGGGKEYVVEHGMLGHVNKGGDNFRSGDRVTAADLGGPEEVKRLLELGAISEPGKASDDDDSTGTEPTGLYTPDAAVGDDVVVVADAEVEVQPSHDNQSQG